MPEKSVGEHVIIKSGDIYSNELTIKFGNLMHSPGDEVFSHTGLTRDKNGFGTLFYGVHISENRTDLFIGGDYVAEFILDYRDFFFFV